MIHNIKNSRGKIIWTMSDFPWNDYTRYEVSNGWFCDFPIFYPHNRKIAYDFPEAIPKYVKKYVEKYILSHN